MRTSSGWKSGIASAAVALGVAGSGSVTGEGDTYEQQGGQQTEPQDGLQALVFVNDYNPAVQFRIVSRIQQPTVNQILGYVNPANPQDGDGAVVDPTDWNGFIFNYIGCGPGKYNVLFVREGRLQQGQTYSFTTDAVYFSDRLQLLESELRTAGGAATDEPAQGTTEEAGQGGGQATAETQTTTPEETTTTTTTEETTTPTETTTTTTTTEGTTTTNTTETTVPTETTTTTTEGTTTTEEVIVNATETDDG